MSGVGGNAFYYGFDDAVNDAWIDVFVYRFNDSHIAIKLCVSPYGAARGVGQCIAVHVHNDRIDELLTFLRRAAKALLKR